MYSDDLLREIESHRNQNIPAAVAVVVRREAPSSGKPGDKALITADGEVKGWIGGGCTRGIVIKEALDAIQKNSPRLVRILPLDDVPEISGVKNYKMTCMSGGAVEVYIEPLAAMSQMYIFGRSQIAMALCEIAQASGFRIQVISELAEREVFPGATQIRRLSDFKPETPLTNDFVVVSTQGEQDTESLLRALESKPRYLGFVSSRMKANGIFRELKNKGVAIEDLSKIKVPAGLDIGAKTPEEVAISIIAEIIQVKRQTATTTKEREIEVNREDLYINPVCKIPIQKSTAKYILEYKDEKVYFCCDGCKESFEKNPEAYIA